MSNWHTRRFTQDYREHERELRHDEPRPGERGFSPPSASELPSRLSPPLTTAMDIVALVKLTPSFTDCETLVQRYADMVAASARAEEAQIAVDRLAPKVPA